MGGGPPALAGKPGGRRRSAEAAVANNLYTVKELILPVKKVDTFLIEDELASLKGNPIPTRDSDWLGTDRGHEENRGSSFKIDAEAANGRISYKI